MWPSCSATRTWTVRSGASNCARASSRSSGELSAGALGTSRVASKYWRRNQAQSAGCAHWTGAWLGSVCRTSKLTAPDFERLARTPCPIASLASSGIKALSSLLARSWSAKASRVLRNSAGELRPGIRRAHVDDADRLDARPRRLGIDQVRVPHRIGRSARTSFRPGPGRSDRAGPWGCGLRPICRRR